MVDIFRRYGRIILGSVLVACGLGMLYAASADASPVPGGTLDPLTIPKYVTPLVIPPEMPKSSASPAPAADYDIAVRQFRQQILPGGIWGSSFPNPLGGAAVGPFPATTVWSYGRAEDPLPDSSGIGGAAGVAPAMNSTFNYPAFTLENSSRLPTKVRWINDLKDPVTGNFLPHLFKVDQSLHWANPTNANCVMMPANQTDCETALAGPYTGPVPLVTHLHGAHVQPHSDGYPAAWWLPGANNIPSGYSLRGSLYTQADTTNTIPGSAYYSYENTQPATTLWYHDHSLGMTRLNVYAGPAGFWLIRGGEHDTAAGVLPGPAPTVAGGDPNFSATVRNAIREIPIAIQDRSFNADGSLFYPADRTFFDGFTGPFIGGAGTPAGPSDILGIWNPEAFFNTMVVNGTTWPKFEVAPARYRLRLLDGCNSRTLNLSLFVVTSLGADGQPGTADDVLGAEVPFYQIGAEQGFLPKVVKIVTGFTTTLPGDGTIPSAVAAPDPSQALLMGPAERADVIVDFSNMANGTRIRMINTAPDAPFGGLPDVPADPSTTGQVMDFIVNNTLTQPGDATTTPPKDLVLPAESPLGSATNTRQVSLNELSSDQVCVEIDAVTGAIVGTLFSTTPGDPNFLANCAAATVTIAGNTAEPMGPREAVLGVLHTDSSGNVTAVPKHWGDAVTESPALNSTEIWEIYNTTMDAHPIHVHLVAFQVVNREPLDPAALVSGNLVPSGTIIPPNPNEMGYKDTVVALPGQITRIKAKFDIAGLYVWHCHIVEHEDNEMMRPFVVSNPAGPISGISTTTASGSYKAGSQVNITVVFDQPVTTTGLTILLNSGASIGTGALTNATYFSGTYTVAAGENATLLNVSQITGSVTDYTGNTFVDPAVPSVNIANSATIVVDTAAPVITVSPVAGTYENSLSVQLTANETAKIYYTTNGATPTVSPSDLYTGSIVLTPAVTTSYTLKYFAVDQLGNNGAVKTVDYLVHVSDLVGSIKINDGSPYTANPAVTLTLAATDPLGVTHMQFSSDGVNFTPLEAYGTGKGWTLDPGEGLKTVYVRFKDGAGILYTYFANITLSAAAASKAIGDLNGDAVVDIRDALKALQISIGLTTPTTAELVRGDVAPLVNGVSKPDGVVDIADALLILRRILGMVSW